MKKKPQKTSQKTAVDRVKARISPAIPCINADKEGYCTGPCEGALCFKCADYKPAKSAPEEPVPDGMYTTALTVPMNEIAFPSGVETLGEKANWLHTCSVELSKRSTAAAILAGWVLSVARSTCAHGQWLPWLAQNVSFARTTADNYMTLYAQTLGKARAAARRPVALTVEPTMAELETAAHDVDGTCLSAIYRSTRLMATNPEHGGKREGAGRHKKGDAAAEAAELDAIANNPALLFAAAKGPLDELWKLHRERNLFARLGDEELTQVVGVLQPLYKYAAGILEDRMRSKGFPVI